MSTALALVAVLLLVPFFRPSVAAQVGYDPAHSPFQDLARASGLTFRVGWLGGERGRVGVGHANGSTFTLGYELPLGGTANVMASVTYALTDRFVVDPFKDDSVRTSGPFKDDMLIVEAGLRFNLTGRKTWRNLAPYISASAGIAASSGSPTDSSGYRFKRKITFGPGMGLRWYPSRRVAVVLDGRAIFWRLRYPPDFHAIRSPDGIPVLAPDQPLTDWTVHPAVSVGLGWTF